MNLIRNYRDAVEYMNKLGDDTPILVYAYSPEKPYSFRSPRGFPYSDMGGADNGKPFVKRIMKHNSFPIDAIRVEDVMLVSGFWEWETVSLRLDKLDSFDELVRNFRYQKDIFYSKDNIQHFFNMFRGENFRHNNLLINTDDIRKHEIIVRLRRLEKVITEKQRIRDERRDSFGISVATDELALLYQRRDRQHENMLNSVYRLFGIQQNRYFRKRR